MMGLELMQLTLTALNPVASRKMQKNEVVFLCAYISDAGD